MTKQKRTEKKHIGIYLFCFLWYFSFVIMKTKTYTIREEEEEDLSNGKIKLIFTLNRNIRTQAHTWSNDVKPKKLNCLPNIIAPGWENWNAKLEVHGTWYTRNEVHIFMSVCACACVRISLARSFYLHIQIWFGQNVLRHHRKSAVLYFNFEIYGAICVIPMGMSNHSIPILYIY